LAERHEVVEALEHDVLVIEVLAALAVLEPVPGERLFGFGGLAGSDVRQPIVDPRLQECEMLF
jgi:hypothetical protein